MLGRKGQLKLKSLGFYLWLSQNSGPDFCNEHWFSKKVRSYPILYIYIYVIVTMMQLFLNMILSTSQG